MSDPAATTRALRRAVDVRTLEMLVCPLTKTRLVLADDGTELISVAARLAFPIRDGVPMLALDEAREVDPDELQTRLPRLAGAQEEEGEGETEALGEAETEAEGEDHKDGEP